MSANNLGIMSIIAYLEMHGVCLISLLLLYTATYLYNKREKTPVNPYIQRTYYSYIGMIVTDAIWNIISLYGGGHIGIAYIVNVLHFISSAVGCVNWYFYQEVAGRGPIERKSWQTILMTMPAFAVIVIAVASPWTQWLFYIEADGTYHRGIWFIGTMIMNYSYVFFASFRSFNRGLHAKTGLVRKSSYLMAMFFLPVIISLVLQMLVGGSIYCVGFTVSLALVYFATISEKRRSQMELINGLSENFEVVFLVNGDSDTMHTLRVKDSYLQRFKLPKDGSAYSAYIADILKEYVPKNNADFVRQSFTVQKIAAAIRKEGTCRITYSMTDMKGVTNHYRAKMVRVLEKDGFLFLLALRNVEAEISAENKREIQLREINAELTAEKTYMQFYVNTFISAYYVSLKDGSFIIQHSSKRIWETDGKQKNFFDVAKKFVGTVVNPEDRKAMIAFADAKVLREKLSNTSQNRLAFVFRMNDEGRERYYRITIISSEDKEHIAVGLMDIDKDVRDKMEMQSLRERKEFDEKERNLYTVISAMTEDYEILLHIDFATGNAEYYRMNPQYKAIWTTIPASATFSEKIAFLARKFVVPEERGELCEQFTVKKVMATIATGAVYTFRFRSDVNGTRQWFEIRAVHHKEHIGKKCTIIGLRNIDVEVRAELARQEELRQKNEMLNRINIRIIDVMADIVESRDSTSGSHIHRVKSFTYILAREVMSSYPEYHLTEEKVRLITLTSAMHDIGKISISDTILLKPGRLTPEEFDVMKTHTTKGAEYLEKVASCWSEEYLQMSRDICMYHHEKVDGHGYPSGLKGDEIPIAAQIVSVADIYDALTTQRPYKAAFSPDMAMQMILNGDCGAFSEKLKKCLVNCSEQFRQCVENPESFAMPDNVNV